MPCKDSDCLNHRAAGLERIYRTWPGEEHVASALVPACFIAPSSSITTDLVKIKLLLFRANIENTNLCKNSNILLNFFAQVREIGGYPQFLGYPRSGGTCAISSRPPFVRFSYEGKVTANQHGKRGVSSLLRIPPQNWGEAFRIGQTPAANLTYPRLRKRAPFSRLKNQPRNYDAGGTNPEIR